MDIETIIEFTAKASIRTLVYVYDDEDALVDPTSVLVTLIDADGLRSSTATATTANHLIDSNGQFTAKDVGKTIYNSTDETTAEITVFNSASDVTLDTDIMTNGEDYEVYCVYEENVVSTGRLEKGIFEHFYNTSKDSAKGWWPCLVEVVDGTGGTARTSIGNYSVKVK